MKKYLLSIMALATLVIFLQVPGFAQKARSRTSRDSDTSGNRSDQYDEIIIKRKGDKNAKVTVEIKDGEVLVDGKPVSEYNSDELSVRKRKMRVMDGGNFFYNGSGDGDSFVMPDMPGAPDGPAIAIAPNSLFRSHGGNWDFDDDNWSGSSKRALLGVTTEKSEKDGKGAKITQISSKTSAAAKAGLQVGDLITKIDEIIIDGPESLSEAIHKYKPEEKVTVTFKRDGKEQKITATLGKMRSAQVYNFQYDMPKVKDFGYNELTPRGQNNWSYSFKPKLGIKAQDTEDGKGVKVLDVDDESAAEKAGIKEGDIITRFDGKDVNSANDLSEGARAAKDKVSIKVNLLRDGKPQEIEIKIPKKLRTANL